MAYTTIDDPSAYFQIAEWTGNDSSRSITFDGNSDMQPDLMWFKNHSELSRDHQLQDSSRGVTKTLQSNAANGESDLSNLITSFNSDGFSLGNNALVNEGSATIVGWGWKANGGSTTTNDASATSIGSIDSVYQANTTAGFSIVTHTGTGSNGTIAHGLGTAPSVVLLKCRSNDGSSWMMFHTGLGNNAKTLALDSSDAEETESSPYYSFNNTAPTSTVFSVGAGNTTNGSSRTFVTYCFAEKQGYSKFGTYTGNGETDNGGFIYTGFKVGWFMVKSTSSGGAWQIYDSKRQTFNDGSQPCLKANTNDVQFTKNVELLSNGIKLRDSTSDANGSGVSYIYLAFASSPFVGSDKTPTTAF